MKNNIKKAPVKFREDLLYFQHFMLKYTVTDQHRPKPDCVDGAVAVSFS